MENFHSFGLPQQLMQSIDRLKFTKPTPIQTATIPLALQGRDILGSAQTGTGKTAAFGLPLLAKLLANPQGSALVITPTRELATQVMQALKDLLGHSTPIKTALIIGGEAMGKQFQQLRMHPRLFVGTPGRINDHLTRGTLKLNDTNFLVLDEMDRMLDMGFSIQIEKITKHLPKERQTLLFSATMPQNILKLAASYLNQPERISMGSHSNPAENIKHEMIPLSEVDKYQELLKQLDKREGSIIIFIKTKYAAEKMAKRLKDDHHSADALHGDLRHNKRESVIKAFRNSKYRILVATDVASRGLDIPHIEHVINYDLPQCAEDYIHRIGRTARAGAEGEAICFVTPSERGKWHAINRLMNPNAAPEPREESRGAPRRDGRTAPRSDSRSDGRRPAKNYARASAGGYSRGAPEGNSRGKPGGNFGGNTGGKPAGNSGGHARPERSGEQRRDQKPKGFAPKSHESRGYEPRKSWGDKPKARRTSSHRP